MPKFKPSNPHTVNGDLNSIQLSKIRSGIIPEIKARFGRINWSTIGCKETAPNSYWCFYYLAITLSPGHSTIMLLQRQPHTG